MKKTLAFAVLAIGAAVGLVFAYLEMREERALEASAEAPIVPPSRSERGADGVPMIRLDAETRARLGLQTATAEAGTISHEITGTAQVLDGAPLAAQWNEVRAAQVALDAAHADYERKKNLFDHGQNAAASAVESAEALEKQSGVAVDQARDRIAATWGPVVAARDDLESLARSLLRREAMLLRVDLLPSDRLEDPSATARLFRQSGEELTTARLLGPAPSVDAATVGRSLLCLANGEAASSLVPGSTLVARIGIGKTDKGTVIPRGAVVRHLGGGWIYVQTEPDTFTRTAVPLDRPHPDGWLVGGEWPQPILVSGAQSLLSEELKGAIQMKD